MHKTALALLLLAPPAAAQAVYYVDDAPGPGIDFTDLQDAIDASSPGDRIEVFDGSYGDVTLGSGITVMAVTPLTANLGFVRVEQLPLGETVVLADFAMARCTVEDSLGTVVVDGGLTYGVYATGAEDVRVRGIHYAQFRSGFTRSFAQFTQCTMGAVSALDSELVLSHCDVFGERGEDAPTCLDYGGDGGPGIWCDGSAIWALRSTIVGGAPGYGCWIGWDGAPGHAFEGVDSTVVECESTVVAPQYDLTGTSQRTVALGLATTSHLGGNRVGETARFVAEAGVGTSVRVYAGRRALRTPFAGTLDVLHSAERGISLGFMGATGSVELPFTIPALPRGTLVYFQARRTASDGVSSNSNCHPLVVR